MGQLRLAPGEVKITYGTAAMLDLNVGPEPLFSMHGAYPLVLWQRDGVRDVLPRGHGDHRGRGRALAARRPRHHRRRRGVAAPSPHRCRTAAACGRSRRSRASARRTSTPARARCIGGLSRATHARARRARGARGHRLALSRGLRRAPRRLAASGARSRCAPTAARRATTSSCRPRPTRSGCPSSAPRCSTPPRSAPPTSPASPPASGRGTDDLRHALAARARLRAAPAATTSAPTRFARWQRLRGAGARDGGRIVSRPPLARDLADEVVALRDAPTLPAAVLDARAATCSSTTSASPLGGAGEESSVALRRGLDAPRRCAATATVLGTDERLPAPQAALANGAAAHALEMDDTHQGGSIHLGASVFPAALAAAELARRERRRAAARRGRAATRSPRASRWRSQPGGALRARLPSHRYVRRVRRRGGRGPAPRARRRRPRRALGIAGSQASGSMEFLADGAWTKRLHPGLVGLRRPARRRARRGPASARPRASSRDASASCTPTPERRSRTPLTSRPATASSSCTPASSRTPAAATCRRPIDAALALRARARASTPPRSSASRSGLVAAGLPHRVRAGGRRSDGRARWSTSSSACRSASRSRWRAARRRRRSSCPRRCDDPAIALLMDRVGAVRDAALDARVPARVAGWVRIVAARRAGRVERARRPTRSAIRRTSPTPPRWARSSAPSLGARCLPSAWRGSPPPSPRCRRLPTSPGCSPPRSSDP